MTSDLISREEAIRILDSAWVDGTEYQGYLHEEFEKLPSAERRGKWTIVDRCPTVYMYHCSNCGSSHRARYDYCPTCGACMED